MTPAETVAAQLQPSCFVRVVDDKTIEVTGTITGPRNLHCQGVTIRFCEGGFSEWPDCIKNGTLADMKLLAREVLEYELNESAPVPDDLPAEVKELVEAFFHSMSVNNERS